MDALKVITPQDTLAELAVTRAGASRVFHRHGLDFCCHGRISLTDACAPKQIVVEELIGEIEAEERLEESFSRWDHAPLTELVGHILMRFHVPLSPELPRLVSMARRVEAVHGEKATCPAGLTAVLERLSDDLELHMRSEEQDVFPAILAGRGSQIAALLSQTEGEHERAGADLARLRELTQDHTAPPEACGTWSALYLGLADLERDLMDHIHLENNILFPRALRS